VIYKILHKNYDFFNTSAEVVAIRTSWPLLLRFTIIFPKFLTLIFPKHALSRHAHAHTRTHTPTKHKRQQLPILLWFKNCPVSYLRLISTRKRHFTCEKTPRTLIQAKCHKLMYKGNYCDWMSDAKSTKLRYENWHNHVLGIHGRWRQILRDIRMTHLCSAMRTLI
jgi:hypothetical protein